MVLSCGDVGGGVGSMWLALGVISCREREREKEREILIYLHILQGLM